MAASSLPLPRLLFLICASVVILAPTLLQAATQSDPAPLNATATSWALQPPRVWTPAELDREVAALQADLLREVPRTIVFSPARQDTWIALAQAEAARSETLHIQQPQLVVVIDRSEVVEELAILLARPDGSWQVLGGVNVSTGQAGRFDHYITPTGVFLHTADILDYRAEGTFNENGVRGLGVKGMRVWDFGWQWATKGWRTNGERGQIRLEMHATDPDLLAQRIGRTASQGCIRVPDAMNRFLDRHGVLDVDYEHAAVDDARYRAVLLPGRTPTPLAGNALIVIDSSGRD